MNRYDYLVTWAEKEQTYGTRNRMFTQYWFLPAHDKYLIESVEPIYITKSFGERINKANMGSIISGYQADGKKITVKIGTRRW